MSSPEHPPPKHSFGGARPSSAGDEDRAPVGPDLHAIALKYLVYALAVAAVFTLASGLAGTTPLYTVRLVSYLGLFVVAVYLRRRELTVIPILLGFYVLWWVMPVVDLATEVDFGYESRPTMALALVIVSIAITGLNRERSWLVPLFSVVNGSWVVVTGLQAGVTTAVLGDELVAMVIGYWLMSRMILRLTREADEGYRRARRVARVEELLAATSERLLGGAGDPVVEEALTLLATGVACDALVVEEVDREGDGVRRVVAVVGEVAADRTRDGKVGDLPTLEGRVAGRRAISIDVESLGSTEADRYGPIRSELAVPIVVRDRHWGRLSALSTDTEHSWNDDEILLFTRTADTIAAFWEREDANERLRELMRSKDAFIASVSHELRTPLTVVVGLAEELASSSSADLDQPEIDELHRMVAEQSSEMAQIVEDLLVAARADLGTLTVRYARVDVRVAIEEVVARLDATFLKGRDFRLEGSTAHANVDPLRFRQIIRNLVTNASKYGGNAIQVVVTEKDEVVEIAVTDNGPGIPRELAEAVFEPYTSAHLRNGQPGSMGLGLTVARDLSRLMGGDLSLYQQTGRTTFVASFPRYTPAPPS